MTMDRGVKIPWIGGQNTMSSGLGIPRVVGAIYHGKRGQNIMYRRSKYHGYGVRYTMGKGFKMPCIGGQNTMDISWVMGSKYNG